MSLMTAINILYNIIMSTEKIKQNQNITAEQKIFQRIYNRKFINQAVVALTQKRRIVASQLKQNKNQFDILANDSDKIRRKSKSVGSLLPQIKEIEVIAKNQKQVPTKKMSNSLSKLDVYLSQKNVKRSDQLNLVFITQQNSIVSDRIMNQKFNQFIAINQQDQPKNLRALLSLTGGFEISQQYKKSNIEKQKKQLQQIVKKMIEQNHLNEQIKIQEPEQQVLQNQQQKSSAQVVPDNIQRPHRSINWVLKQCKDYDKKFRVKNQKKQSKSKKDVIISS